MINIGTGLSVFVGGARSGKSDLVVQLASRWSGPVTMVATATAGDDDMAERIKQHRLDRPAGWGLIEAPLADAAIVTAVGTNTLIVLDCVTMLVANLMFADRSESEISDWICGLARALTVHDAPALVVTNEVGMGVHPETELGRRYRDVLGRANKLIVDASESAILMIAGRAVPLQEVDCSW